MLDLPDGPEREALFKKASEIVVAYMPYRIHVHRIYNDFSRAWITGYRQPLLPQPELALHRGRRRDSAPRRSPEPAARRWRRREAADPRLHALAARARAASTSIRRRPTATTRFWRWSCDDLPAFWQSVWDYFGIESPTPHRAVLASTRRCRARAGSPARRSTTRGTCSRHADAAHAAGHPAIVFQNEAMQLAGDDRGDLLARAAAPGRRRSRPRSRHGRRRRRPRRAPSCPTCRRRRSPSSPAPASARSGRCARPTWGRSRCSTASARSSRRCWSPATAIVYGGVAHDRLAGAARARWPSCRACATLVALALASTAAADAGALAAPDAARARLRRADRRRRDVRAGLAAVRPSALDRLLERHHRPAQADRARPRRHHARGAEGRRAAQRRRPERRHAATATTGTARPAGSCGTRRSAALLGGTTVCMYDGSPPGRERLAGAAREVDWSTLWRFAAATGVTFFGAGAAFYASCLKAGVEPRAGRPTCRRCAPSARPARRCRSSATSWICEQLPQVDGAADLARPDLRRHRLRRRLRRRHARPCRWSTARCSAAAWARRSRPGASPTPTAADGR